MTTEVMERNQQEMFEMTVEDMEKNAEDPRYQVYLKLLPQDCYETGKEIILSTPVESLEDVFQDILSYIHDNDVWGYVSSSEDDWYNEDDAPTLEDMSEYEEYISKMNLQNEIEDLEKMIETKYTNYPNDVISVKDARVLAEEYNKLPCSEVEIVGQMSRKTKYEINYYTVVIITKYVKKEKMNLAYLVEFLDKFHEYKILDSTLY